VRPPPFHWWRTVFFLIPAIACYTIVLGTISLTAGLFDPSGRFSHRCAQWWARWILATTGVRVARIGAPLPPANQSAIFVANHASIYDIPIVFTAVPYQLRIMAKATLGRVPFIGWHLQRSGHLLVNRSNPGAAIFKKMQRLATQGASLIVFPEGSRSPDGQVGRFKGGIFLLAIETGLPIVPITVVGSRAVMPKGRLMTCPADVRVVVHEPIATSGLTREDARGLADRVREVVASGLDDR
jgi:1-acyl-sn-glycerol-3-phosphate acyltransferase